MNAYLAYAKFTREDQRSTAEATLSVHATRNCLRQGAPQQGAERVLSVRTNYARAREAEIDARLGGPERTDERVLNVRGIRTRGPTKHSAIYAREITFAWHGRA